MYDMIPADVQIARNGCLNRFPTYREMHGLPGRLPIVALTANALATQAGPNVLPQHGRTISPSPSTGGCA